METPSRSINYRQAIGGTTAKVYRLHPCEKTLAWITALILIFQPWALGGMRLWSQYIVGGLALLAFAVALIPRNYTNEHHAGGSFHLRTWPKLMRFPIFWLGLIYFVIILIQIANPAWQVVSSEKGWWLQRIEYIRWLPHGVADTPASMMNGWRTMLIQGAAWLLVCALWIGVTRRKTSRILITTIALNGVAIALILFLQRLTGTRELLWFVDVKTAYYFAGSFFYKNHAGGFLVLIIAATLGLAWWHMAKAERELQKSHPGMIFVFIALITFAALTMTYARVATVLGAILIIVAGGGFVLRIFSNRFRGLPPLVTAIISLLVIGFLTLTVVSFDTNKLQGRFKYLLTEKGWFHAATVRQLSTSATYDMAKDSFWFGHGAGSYRFLFPKYQKNYPEIWMRDFKRGKRMVPKRLYWEHAHNDYVEMLSEMGLLGASIIFSGITVIGWGIRRHFLFSSPPLIAFLSGPALIMLSAYVDFPMHNPAILLTGSAIIVLTFNWAALTKPVER